MDPAALLAWLPPGEMTGKMHAFDARLGGGYKALLHAGKPVKLALTVGMRKVIVLANALIRDRRTWTERPA